ncbi:diguanylate cyclase/phosphodiesterase [Sulfurivirga caldicuralii]|uniref:Diguanylate cyclase/phosphodiesterase n=1 Tax=Sulfurivirga caldicuralii TaxID=364032 RepID=A0A1N6DTU8_9GAMM|nr:bifunctional diguanylate cyclase/phosphodiesterase [Sulfurivirga caldicuralii]SIN74133.1 diguanylate cyclase/phosphodiesterase [Sulfurivirga caldicuralii]
MNQHVANACVGQGEIYDSDFVEQARKKITLDHDFAQDLYDIFQGDRLTTLYQPIVDIGRRETVGWESLTRGPVDSSLHRPLDLFFAAEKADVLFELDALARLQAIETFSRQRIDDKCKLFINVMVGALASDDHIMGLTSQCLSSMGLSPDRVVIELSELHPVADDRNLVKAVEHYRAQGFSVALDDVGAGYNGLRIWAQVQPDLVKIDRYFVSEINSIPEKRRFMESMINLAHSFGAKVVVEGVETEDELRIIEQMGADLVQGYLLGRPAPRPRCKPEYVWPQEALTSFSSSHTAGGLISSDYLTLPPSMRVDEAMEVVLKQAEQDFYPVVNEAGKVEGMIWRREFMQKLLQRYGYELNYRKPITELMDAQPVVVDEVTPIETLSRMLTDDAMREQRDAFIVTRKGCYAGVGTFVELLRVMTDLKVKSAQYANPLSGLPGNVPIQAEIQRRLEKGEAFSVLYIDLDHFKPFNDYYSYEDGDRVIRFLGHLLTDLKGPKDFVGHIGGDDFVVILPEGELNAVQWTRKLIARFAPEITRFYKPEDQARGGIEAVDREGALRFFPLMSLSIGIIVVDGGAVTHQQMLASLMTQAKKRAKAESGNGYACLHVNRAMADQQLKEPLFQGEGYAARSTESNRQG